MKTLVKTLQENISEAGGQIYGGLTLHIKTEITVRIYIFSQNGANRVFTSSATPVLSSTIDGAAVDELAIPSNTNSPIYCHAGEYDLFIENKYRMNVISLQQTNSAGIYSDIEAWGYMPRLAEIKLDGGINIVGDIKWLAENANVNMLALQLYGTSITGDIAFLCDKLVERGRTSGAMTYVPQPRQNTFDGELITNGASHVVRFTSDTTTYPRGWYVES